MQVTLQADQRPKQNHKDAILPVHPQELYPLGRELLTDVEPGEYSIFDYPLSNKLIHLLRHGSLPRDKDGAIEFWKIKDNLQEHFLYCHHWSDDQWKNPWQDDEETRKDFSIVLIHQEQSCTSQDNVVIPSDFFLQVHLPRRMCNQFTLHHQFRIDTGRSKFEQQTDSILSACGSHGQRTHGS